MSALVLLVRLLLHLARLYQGSFRRKLFVLLMLKRKLVMLLVALMVVFGGAVRAEGTCEGFVLIAHQVDGVPAVAFVKEVEVAAMAHLIKLMNGTNLFEYCKDTANDGTSVWVFQGKKHLTYLASRLRSIPKFNTNYTYVVINCQKVSVLGD